MLSIQEIAIKIPNELGDANAIEKRIYKRLSTQHPFILQCYSKGELVLSKGLMLQYLSVGTLVRNLEIDKFP